MIGKPCTFKVDYVLENVPGRSFGSVFIGPENVALTVVSKGWAKVMPTQIGNMVTPCMSYVSFTCR